MPTNTLGFTQAMRLYVNHPPDPGPELVVEVVANADAAAIDALRVQLARLGCPNGLIIDENTAVLLRDTYASLDADSFAEGARVPTARLLARMPALPLAARVQHWLRSMSASWNDALPAAPEDAAPFIQDVVPAVVGSSIRQVA